MVDLSVASTSAQRRTCPKPLKREEPIQAFASISLYPRKYLCSDEPPRPPMRAPRVDSVVGLKCRQLPRQVDPVLRVEFRPRHCTTSLTKFSHFASEN